MEIRIVHVIELSSSLMALVAAAASGAPASAAAFQGSSRPAEPKTAADATMPEVAATQGGETADAGDPNELDSAGWPWSADLHASTKGKTKEGLWRMKVGVSRPDPKPGFPKDGGTASTSTAQSDGSTAATATAGPGDDEDEFAAFRAAADKANAPAAEAPARKWTDADLGALCNQAAVKLGDPAPVKAAIAKHVPEGQVAHSRNVPEDQRAAFAAEVEKTAGITFAG